MVTKESAVKIIHQLGYEADIRDGVVLALVPDSKCMMRAYNELKQALKIGGYDASFGVKVVYAPPKHE